MPRPVSTSVKTVSSTVTRGKAKAIRVTSIPEAESEKQCPLCINDFDEDEYDNFRPCPCGYLLCVFCYYRVKELCAGLCPNCRREYGSVDEAVTETSTTKIASTGLQNQLNGSGKQAKTATRSNGTAEVRPPPPPPRLASNSKPHVEADVAGRKASENAAPAVSSWATAGPSQRTQSDTSRPSVDDTAWPSLSTCNTTVPSAKVRSESEAPIRKNAGKIDQGGSPEHDDARATSSKQESQKTHQMDPSLHQAILPQSESPAVSLINTNAPAQNVQSEMPHVRKPPQYTPWTSSMQPVISQKETAGLQETRTSTSSNDIAAAQLFAMFNPKDNVKAQALLAAGKIPPGFAPPTQVASPTPVAPSPRGQTSLVSVSHINSLNNQDNPIVPGPPAARYHPIAPPVPYGHGTSSGMNGVCMPSVTHEMSSQRGVYSIWSGSCLPGVDISRSLVPSGSDIWGLYQPMTSTMGSSGPTLGAQPIGVSSRDPVVVFPTPIGPKRPPPGFGPMTENSSRGVSQPQYQAVVPQKFNLVEGFARVNQAPMAPYRPPLGMGV